MSDDPKLSQRYRELPREEPPRALDDAILAASRRAIEARPAPLVAPTGRRRWYVPLAAAAVITLAVAVTLHVERDRPGEEVDAVGAMKAPEAPPAPAPQASEAPKAAPEKPAPSLRKEQAPRRDERRAPQPFAGAPAADSVGSLSSAPPEPPATVTQGARMRRDRAEMARSSVAQAPETELERIARLRAEGRHEEADRALAEFRKRYPDYRLSDEMKAKVERPKER